MVQSWQNFMSPSGGSYDNGLIDGTSGLLLGFGVDLIGRPLANSLERHELKMLGRKTANLNMRAPRNPRDLIKSNITTFYPSETGVDEYAYTNPERHKTLVQAKRQKILSRRDTASRNIKSSYGGIKSLLRGVSIGYLAITAGMMAEAAVTPGLTMSAVRENSGYGMNTPIDSNQAYTQRQRALQAIHESQLGIRNVIGSEAHFFHR